MREIIKITGWLLFIMGLVTIMLFSGNEYQWMQDMEPSITALPQRNGNRGNQKINLFYFSGYSDCSLFSFSITYRKGVFSPGYFAITDYRMEL